VSMLHSMFQATKGIDQFLDPASKFSVGGKSVDPNGILDKWNSKLDRQTATSVPKPPPIPNPNDAQNASQAQQDALRQRRGLLATLYAGNTGGGGAPMVGSAQLGT
jgi:hypothetical protein